MYAKIIAVSPKKHAKSHADVILALTWIVWTVNQIRLVNERVGYDWKTNNNNKMNKKNVESEAKRAKMTLELLG